MRQYFFLLVLSFFYIGVSAQCNLIEIHKNGRVEKRLEYNTKNELAKTNCFEKGKPGGYNLYKYTPSGQRLQVDRFSKEGQAKRQEIYSYDKDGRLVKIVEQKDSRVMSEHVFVYKRNELIERESKERNKKGLFKSKLIRFEWKDGCIVKATFFKKEGSELDLDKICTYTYDNNPNPFFGKGESIKNLSKHNVIEKKAEDRFKMPMKKDSFKAKIQYNVQGFPLEIIQNYDKKKKTTIYTFHYQCI